MMGVTNASILQAVAPVVKQAFDADTGLVNAIALPEAAYNGSRGQYHSTMLLDVLTTHKTAAWERLIGVTEVDLYAPDLNFVFGEADSHRGVAVFSVARLFTADRDRFLQRASTEAIHEIAHTYGLDHCHNPRCVMWFSNKLEETDRKGTRFCAAHAEALGRALKRRL
jgi:archaemetzincin